MTRLEALKEKLKAALERARDLSAEIETLEPAEIERPLTTPELRSLVDSVQMAPKRRGRSKKVTAE